MTFTKDYIHPGAPTLYEPGRRCEKCNGKVNRRQEYVGSPSGGAVLLCYLCQSECSKRNMDPVLFVGVERRSRGKNPGPRLVHLRRIRESQNLTVTQLAGRAKLYPNSLYKLESGERGASPQSLKRISRALEVTAEELTG
jgi:Helix-turn-helix